MEKRKNVRGRKERRYVLTESQIMRLAESAVSPERRDRDMNAVAVLNDCDYRKGNVNSANAHGRPDLVVNHSVEALEDLTYDMYMLVDKSGLEDKLSYISDYFYFEREADGTMLVPDDVAEYCDVTANKVSKAIDSIKAAYSAIKDALDSVDDMMDCANDAHAKNTEGMPDDELDEYNEDMYDSFVRMKRGMNM